jgi:hypothetical protein
MAAAVPATGRKIGVSRAGVTVNFVTSEDAPLALLGTARPGARSCGADVDGTLLVDTLHGYASFQMLWRELGRLH